MAEAVPAWSELNGQAHITDYALTDEQRELRKQVKGLTMERDILNEEG